MQQRGKSRGNIDSIGDVEHRFNLRMLRAFLILAPSFYLSREMPITDLDESIE